MQGSNPRASSLCTAGGAANHFTQNSKGTAAAPSSLVVVVKENRRVVVSLSRMNASGFGLLGLFPCNLGVVPCLCVRVCVSCLWGVAATLYP